MRTQERAVTPMIADDLKIGTSGVLHRLIDQPNGAKGIEVLPSKVDEIIQLDDQGKVIVAFKPEYGPRRWVTSEDLGIVPHKDGTWSASAWFKYQ